jgi:predicted nucleotidyltransferase
MRLLDLVEGDYIETVDGLFFAVKGLRHPKGFAIAYLRYIPDTKGDRKKGENRYKRIYNLKATEDYLTSNFPQYLNFIVEKSLILQSIPKDLVSKIYKPRDRLVEILGSPSSDLERAITKIIGAIIDQGVSKKHLGVSGSILIGLTRPESDLDLISYGAQEGRKVYKAIKKLRKNNFIQPYDSKTVISVTYSRWEDTGLDLKTLGKIEEQKFLHGIFNGIDYFIRLVRTPKEMLEEVSKPLAKVRLTATIVEAKNSIFTPCVYQIEGCKYQDSNMPTATTLLSYRGKFTEQAKEGDIIIAHGTLEEVKTNKGIEHRIVLGGIGDYLVPLNLLNR